MTNFIFCQDDLLPYKNSYQTSFGAKKNSLADFNIFQQQRTRTAFETNPEEPPPSTRQKEPAFFRGKKSFSHMQELLHALQHPGGRRHHRGPGPAGGEQQWRVAVQQDVLREGGRARREDYYSHKSIFFLKKFASFLEHTFFSRVSCNFGEGAREGRYSTNRFPKKSQKKIIEKTNCKDLKNKVPAVLPPGGLAQVLQLPDDSGDLLLREPAGRGKQV